MTENDLHFDILAIPGSPPAPGHTRARTRSSRQAHTRAVVVALTLTRAASRCWRRDNDGLCTMSQFLTWARARPQWAKDQLTHCCSVGRTDPLYFTDPSSVTAPFFSAYEQPFLRQVCLSVCLRARVWFGGVCAGWAA